jgi:hypothetical protein
MSFSQKENGLACLDADSCLIYSLLFSLASCSSDSLGLKQETGTGLDLSGVINNFSSNRFYSTI